MSALLTIFYQWHFHLHHQDNSGLNKMDAVHNPHILMSSNEKYLEFFAKITVFHVSMGTFL